MDQVLKIKAISNPKENASILSKIMFWYTFGTFYKGFFKKTLNEEDIPQVLDSHKTSKQVDRLEKYWKIEKSGSKPSLWIAIGRAFYSEFIVLGGVILFEQLLLRLLRTLALIQFIKYFSQDDDEINLKDAYLYGGLIGALLLLNVLAVNLSRLYLQFLGMKVRVACSSLIYRKSLRLSKSVLEDVNIGRITNLLSNDLGRFDIGIFFIHALCIGPVDTIVTTIILYFLAGYTSTIGMVFLILWLPLFVVAGKKSSMLRFEAAIRTDARVQLMNEIISGIKVIKMYTWEKPFAKLVDIARRDEVRQIRSISYIRGLIKFGYIASKIALFLALLTHVLTGNSVSAVYVFSIISFYENVKLSLLSNWALGALYVPEMWVSIKRVETLLLLEELKRRSSVQKEKLGILLQSVTAKWTKNASKPTLYNIDMNLKMKQLTGIVGPVGSGKSSIFQVILNELPVESGSVDVHGKISYASQELWVFSGNIQQNILFGNPMNLERYKEVIRVCALEKDLVSFPYADQTLVGERGVILSGGQKARVNLARAVYKESDIYLLDDPFAAIDIHVGNHIFHNCINKFLERKCVVLITHQLHFLNEFHCIYMLDNGTISSSGTYQELKMYDLKFSKKFQDVSDNADGGIEVPICGEHKSPVSSQERRNTGTLLYKVLITYLRFGGSNLLLLCVIVAFILFHVSSSMSDLFLAYWINQEQEASQNYMNSLALTNYIYIYTGFITLIMFTTLFRTFVYLKFTARASINLHNAMFNKVVNTAMSFFYTNNTGRILNRFSKDIGIIDEIMPNSMTEVIVSLLTTFGCTILICITNPWFILVTVVVFGIFYLMRLVYMRTSQNLTRLEGTARSPVYGHLNETLQGITTVRAYNAELLLQKEFDNHMDLHSSVWSLFIMCSKTFGFYIDLICVIYIVIVIFTTLFNHTEHHSGSVGLAVTQAISLIGLIQWSMYHSVELQNQMTSVERVLEYVDLKPEHEQEEFETPTGWPKNGNVKFEMLSLKYSQDQPYILKNLNFSIESAQKIGIVGRTGAGKSSLITALFQLAKTEGVIYIDHLDISKISAHSVRSNISIIPQDPVLFSGTVRKNLDPFGVYSDLEVWSALDEVQLKKTVSSLPLGLDDIVSNGGLNFSVGQRQLMCLARAIVRQNKILILDEATANVDVHNDTLIQDTIRRIFSDCTVLTIAHRLNTIIDSDKVLVMDAGEIVEYDHPHLLLQNKTGMFYQMLQKMGHEMANALSKIAENRYNCEQSN